MLRYPSAVLWPVRFVPVTTGPRVTPVGVTILSEIWLVPAYQPEKSSTSLAVPGAGV